MSRYYSYGLLVEFFFLPCDVMYLCLIVFILCAEDLFPGLLIKRLPYLCMHLPDFGWLLMSV